MFLMYIYLCCHGFCLVICNSFERNPVTMVFAPFLYRRCLISDMGIALLLLHVETSASHVHLLCFTPKIFAGVSSHLLHLWVSVILFHRCLGSMRDACRQPRIFNVFTE
ncbi:hypothetical protein P170DRAFT_102557 [Aspergillus steynii IBT 23096]|uniref:Uncharacterized protein n=1 Tax=Aspergillus steynii IBT 23096 TaxID=1392250 RepID=A0A2I2GHM6_9EURO|nr:uncharacterized protein P170DRAFT_102557 [Aspergillus steynii IBT 23096]PLB52378.1 hypothetical protein P170DRAFT_102557 [Aspergillus steynii IBT 23096]